jgi:hypothetical protein
MPNYTYTGLEEEFVLRGVSFPQSESVPVNDPEFEAKLDNLPYFDSDKPKETVKPVAVSDSEKDTEISQLKRTIGRLEHENQVLKKRVGELEGAAASAEPEPQEPETIETFTPSSVSEPVSEADIPDDWREMHWKRQVVLAKKFTDMEISNQTDAVTAIELELERRGD